MLDRTQRLSRAQFTEYFKAGRRIHREYGTIIFTSCPNFHGAVVISKKVARGAVVRNRLRRRIYQQLRTIAATNPGVYIVILKPGFSSLTQTQAHQAIKSLLQTVVSSKK